MVYNLADFAFEKDKFLDLGYMLPERTDRASVGAIL